MEAKSTPPLPLFSIQRYLSLSCFFFLLLSFQSARGGRGPIILSLHPHPHPCFWEILIKPACTDILKMVSYSYCICQRIYKSFQEGYLICQDGFLPPQAVDSKTPFSSKLLFRPILSSSFTSHWLAFSNECMYVSCKTKIWMPEINWFACHEWQVTMVTNFRAIFSHFSIYGGNWLQQIGQGIGSPISWRRSRLSGVGKQFHGDGHLEMSKSITGEESSSCTANNFILQE